MRRASQKGRDGARRRWRRRGSEGAEAETRAGDEGRPQLAGKKGRIPSLKISSGSPVLLYTAAFTPLASLKQSLSLFHPRDLHSGFKCLRSSLTGFYSKKLPNGCFTLPLRYFTSLACESDTTMYPHSPLGKPF